MVYKKKDEDIPEVKTEHIDSLLNNVGKMIKNAGDSLQNDTTEKK